MADIGFKEKIYLAAAKIPKGRVATYAQLAELAGYGSGAARAAGNAIHGNTDPVKVPCHRIVRSDGSLGSNYGMGGPQVQKARLKAEGITFIADSGAPAGARVDMERHCIVMETHPLEPFLPAGGKILFLGSFPPPREKWSMEFFYPNWINDFWRIQGLIHYADEHHFEDGCKSRRFDRSHIIEFCEKEGLAFYDTARRICRLKGNASDDFLEIIEPAGIGGFLDAMPYCRTIVTTGGKASETLAGIISKNTGNGMIPPPVASFSDIRCFGKDVRWWRMPSTSRAYPMPLAGKAECYARLFVK